MFLQEFLEPLLLQLLISVKLECQLSFNIFQNNTNEELKKEKYINVNISHHINAHFTLLKIKMYFYCGNKIYKNILSRYIIYCGQLNSN